MINLNKIYNRDCRDFMTELEYHSIQVDIIVTSPRYNIGKNYGTPTMIISLEKIILILLMKLVKR